jgi:hypothetical protein
MWQNQSISNKKICRPQDAVSSTILFNIYIKNLPKCLKKTEGIKVSMSTDNVVIRSSAKINNKQHRTLEKNMNHSLEFRNSWSTENNMIIIKSKTRYQFFSLQHNKAEFSLKIVDQMLQKSANTKYLHVLLDNNTYYFQIQMLCFLHTSIQPHIFQDLMPCHRGRVFLFLIHKFFQHNFCHLSQAYVRNLNLMFCHLLTGSF